jgi:hypothetical protein
LATSGDRNLAIDIRSPARQADLDTPTNPAPRRTTLDSGPELVPTIPGMRFAWSCRGHPKHVPQSEADALALWFRQTAAERVGKGKVPKTCSPGRYRRLLGDAADSAAQLIPGDESLVRLRAAERFSDFYGEVLFVGGGPAIHDAKWESIGDAEASGQKVLHAVITAALSEPAPA